MFMHGVLIFYVEIGNFFYCRFIICVSVIFIFSFHIFSYTFFTLVFNLTKF